MLADVFHWRQIRSAVRRKMRVHLDVGKKAMIVYLLLAVENGARRHAGLYAKEETRSKGLKI